VKSGGGGGKLKSGRGWEGWGNSTVMQNSTASCINVNIIDTGSDNQKTMEYKDDIIAIL